MECMERIIGMQCYMWSGWHSFSFQVLHRELRSILCWLQRNFGILFCWFVFVFIFSFSPYPTRTPFYILFFFFLRGFIFIFTFYFYVIVGLYYKQTLQIVPADREDKMTLLIYCMIAD